MDNDPRKTGVAAAQEVEAFHITAADPAASRIQLITRQIARHRKIVILAFFILLVVTLRGPSFFMSMMDWDEGVYLLMGRSLLDGEVPYTTIWDHKPPGIYLVYGLIQFVLGESIFGLRLAASFAIAVTSYLLYEIGKIVSDGDQKAGLLAGILYAVFTLNNEGLAANTEIFYALPVTLAFYFFFRYRHRKAHGNSALLLIFSAGLALGIALQINYLVVFDLAALIILVAAEILFRHEDETTRTSLLPQAVKSTALLLIGPLILFLITIAYFASAGHLDDYIYANFIAGPIYSQSFDFRIIDLFPIASNQIASNTLLWVVLLVAPLFLFLERDMDREMRRNMVILHIWWILVIPGILFTKRLYPHYFLHMLPPASLITALLVLRIFQNDKFPNRAAYLAALSLLLAVPLVQNIYPSVDLGLKLFYHNKIINFEYDQTQKVARYLQAHVDEDDYISSVDFPPTVYYLVGAKSPTRFVFPPFLTDDTYSEIIGIDSIQELKSIIEKRPSYIIKNHNKDDAFHAELGRYLDQIYVLETTIDDLEFYRLREN
jgi:4-amino-4-deoxy-L-arabinose transferase-like glycosyltransferase